MSGKIFTVMGQLMFDLKYAPHTLTSKDVLKKTSSDELNFNPP